MQMSLCCAFLLHLLIIGNSVLPGYSRKHRSVIYNDKLRLDLEGNSIFEHYGDGSDSTVDFIWYTQTVAAGDTAVLHCSFDAIFSQLRNGNIDWAREKSTKEHHADPMLLAEGKKVLIDDRRYRVYRPHNSALSVLIIRRAKKRDAGIYRCNLSGSSTRHKFMALNVTESKIDARTSPPKLMTHVGQDLTMWCNASGYPNPVVYWTREDSNRKLQDGNYQFWGSGLSLQRPTEEDTGVYACYLDNFVQPVVSYKFSVSVEDYPWTVVGHKMRFDSKEWYPAASSEPAPVRGMSYLLMCETQDAQTPLPQIRWLRNGKPITNTKHFYIIEDRPDIKAGSASSTLVIMRFVPRFQGNYTCVGSNSFRKKTQNFFIHSYLNPNELPAPDIDSADVPPQPPGHNNPASPTQPALNAPKYSLPDDDDDDDDGGSAMMDADITTDDEDVRDMIHPGIDVRRMRNDDVTGNDVTDDEDLKEGSGKHSNDAEDDRD